MKESVKRLDKGGRNMVKSSVKESKKGTVRKGTLLAKNSLERRDRGLEKTDR